MYRIEITADTLSELAGKAMSLAVKLNTGTATEAPIIVGLPPVKSEVELKVVEEVPADPTPSQPAPAAEAPASDTLNFDIDVAPYVLQVVKEKGKPVAQEILSQFGVEKASLLDPARWPELVEVLKEAL